MAQCSTCHWILDELYKGSMSK